ncbi:MAG TPA: acetate kinase [Deinococcales bacterium]|nr:acetate kinase [Deinococcales bacterium]
MEILVVNCGSSSLKYATFDMDTGEVLNRGLLERVGTSEATYKRGSNPPVPVNAPDHATGFAAIAAVEDFSRVAAVGHRIVHGGSSFSKPEVVNDEVVDELIAIAHLAPLHNRANVQGIRGAAASLPGRPMVLCFDTGFHATLPPRAFLYAIPRDLYEQDGIRKYGFHGTSHQYVAGRVAEILERPLGELKTVTLHLGNGASACAVLNGESIDTSMGFTPLGGLMMGSRSGDMDPAVALEVAARHGVDGARDVLNTKSGLLGLCGASDLRDVWRLADGGDRWAQWALDVYAYRVRKVIGEYAAAMGGLDAIVFTAGVGENDAGMRAKIVEGLDFLGVTLDAAANAERRTVISRPEGRVKVMVIPTNEEWAIALETRQLVEERGLIAG